METRFQMQSRTPANPLRSTLNTLAGLALAAILLACTGQAMAMDPPLQQSMPTPDAPAQVAPGESPSAAPMDAVDGQPPAQMATPRPRAYEPGPPVPRVAPLEAPAHASRVVIGDLGIDLPVVSGDLQPPPNYPFCDVAAYVTRFGHPYETGITYISAHAQRGMFAPMLAASERNDGAELLGMPVQVYVSDGRLFEYRIERVNRHATDYSIVQEIPLEEQTLILQTSEGPYGTIEKVQVVATLESETPAELAEANPEPHPRDCEPTG
jgi:hypothetical protein